MPFRAETARLPNPLNLIRFESAEGRTCSTRTPRQSRNGTARRSGRWSTNPFRPSWRRATPVARDARKTIAVVGAGIAGSWQALLFAKAGCAVTLFERGDATLAASTSFWAGGMLAPDCESETAEPMVVRLGRRSLELWRDEMAEVHHGGSLVVAHPRDRADFERFARLTCGHERVDARRLAELEPMLAGRFAEGLYFNDEAHVEPRQALALLHRCARGERRVDPFRRRL